MAVEGVGTCCPIQGVGARRARRRQVYDPLAGKGGAVGERDLAHAILGVVAESGRQHPVELHLVAGDAIGQEHVAALVPGHAQAGHRDPGTELEGGGAVGVVAGVLLDLQLAVARLETRRCPAPPFPCSRSCDPAGAPRPSRVSAPAVPYRLSAPAVPVVVRFTSCWRVSAVPSANLIWATPYWV